MQPPSTRTAGGIAERIGRRAPSASLPAALVALILVLAVASQHFFTWDNLVQALVQAADLAVVGLGMTFVVIGGGLDLSVGSLAALTDVLAALAMKATGSVAAGAGVALAAGALAGLLNGLLVVFRGVPSLIATLGMLVIARGLALAVSNGRPVAGLPPSLGSFVYRGFWGVPWVVLSVALLYAAGYVLLHHTVFGLRVYVVGSNARAGQLSGLPVRRTQLLTYVISGICAGFAGLILTARLRSGQPTVGVFLELFAVTAVVLGGNSLYGGRGSVAATIFGVLMIAYLQNGLNLLSVNTYYQNIVLALVLVATASTELLRRRGLREESDRQRDGKGSLGLRIVDLSHPVTIHSPGWFGYPGMKLWYWQTHHTNGIVSQMIECPLHLSTHIDAPMHGISGGGDMASVPLERLVGPAAIADVSEVGEWGVYTPELVQSKVEVRRGDILILHTGWHRYYSGMPEEDLPRYFCMHPGPDVRFAQWVVEMEFRWVGVDCGSADHPMNTSIRERRPDLVKGFEQRFGISPYERFPQENLFCMHREPFRRGVIHAENLGGEIATLLNRRCVVGAFPWKFVGGEASICRIVAFPDLAAD